MMMMHYAGSISNRTKKTRRCLQVALIAKCNEERQVGNTCKFKAAGDTIFLLTFNLLYMLVVHLLTVCLLRMDALLIVPIPKLFVICIVFKKILNMQRQFTFCVYQNILLLNNIVKRKMKIEHYLSY
jgi:hypothetical protein